MSCEHPLLAVNLGKFEDKFKIKIMPKRLDLNLRDLELRYGHENILLLPCGSCPSCRMAHKKQWAVRCALEASYYKDNCMITLTYSDERRPKRLIKRDLQAFIKNMRNRGYKFRYFACGEYGELNHNCHFHIIMFGFWPKDSKYMYSSKSGFPIYSSDLVSDVWKNGIISISEMSPGTAAYVAGYVDKKLFNDEFVLMSKRPGIGERYFQEHLFDIYAYDNLVGSFGVARVPRYCDKLAEQVMDLDDLKKKRRESSNWALIQDMLVHGFNHKEMAMEYNGRLMRDKLARKRRVF